MTPSVTIPANWAACAAKLESTWPVGLDAEAEGAKVHSGFFRSYNDSALHENMVAAVRQMMEEHPGVTPQ